MEIFKIEDHKSNRKLVYFDEGTPAFCLYNKEIRAFELKEGKEIPAGVYEEISALLSKRARERALYLLDDMPRTERQIRDKLKEGYYPEAAIDYAVDYCKSKHYIDDLEYALSYISGMSDRMSRRMMEQKLFMRGVDKETIDRAFEESDVSDEEVIKSLLERKYGKEPFDTYEARQKLIKKLTSKGFSYDTARRAVEQYGGEP